MWLHFCVRVESDVKLQTAETLTKYGIQYISVPASSYFINCIVMVFTIGKRAAKNEICLYMKQAVNKKAKPNRQEIDRKKRLAYTLFVENGFEQKIIAEITGISEKSITAWKKDGN